MKRKLVLICSLMSLSSLSGCNGGTHQHTFNDAWETNSTHHWHETTCGHTDVVGSFGAHIFGNDNECDICGYEKPSPVVPHQHTFDIDHWEKNSSAHWHKATCEHTDLIKDMEDHNFGDDNICDTCGYELIVETKHLVYFVTNGGSDVAPIQVADGATVNCPAEPTKENFAFLGWYESPEYTGNPYDFSKNITKNTTLYALWGAKISFMNYDGEVYKESKVKLNSGFDQPENPTWNNAQFMGWYEDREFNGSTFDFNAGVNKNTKLYARYGYTLELIDADGDTISSSLHPADKVVVSPGPVSTDYYNFDNWYSDEARTQIFQFNNKLTGDTKIYLKLEPKTYNITYVGADDLAHTNPTTFTYGVGVSEFFDPTENTNPDTKFYGWYFDEEFTKPATSIPTGAHEDITLYAKMGTYHTFTYIGWPSKVENPNPTKATQYDLVEFDGSALENIPEISGVKFYADSREVLGIANPKQDYTITVDFTSSATKVTFDPNGGKILVKTPFIYISSDCMYGKQIIELTKNDGTFNLYDASVISKLTTMHGREDVFKGYYFDEFYTEPLFENDVNLLNCGDTIYAKFDRKFEVNGKRNIPFTEIGENGNVQPSNFDYEYNVPQGYKSVKVSFDVVGGGTHIFTLCDVTVGSYELKKWQFEGNNSVSEIIELGEVTKTLSFSYIFLQRTSRLESYSYSLELGEPQDCFVKCLPDESPLTCDYYYYKTQELPYSIIEKDYHAFDGWVDDDGNKVDLSNEWLSLEDSLNLKASWVYNGQQEFMSQASDVYTDYCDLLYTDALGYSSQEISDLESNLYSIYVEPLFDKFNEEKGFDYDLASYQTYLVDLKEAMCSILGNTFIGKVNDRKDELIAKFPNAGDEFVSHITEAANNGIADLNSERDNPARQIDLYNEILLRFKAILALHSLTE